MTLLHVKTAKNEKHKKYVLTMSTNMTLLHVKTAKNEKQWHNN